MTALTTVVNYNIAADFVKENRLNFASEKQPENIKPSIQCCIVVSS